MTKQPPMNFEYFETGEHVGAHRMALAPLVTGWRALFPGDAEAGQSAFAPSGVMVAAMMHGYTQILDRRLPGNVHATQTLHWGVPAPVDGEVTVNLTCAEKALRNDRRWLSFHLIIDGAADGAAGIRHLSADLRFLWAT